jgi:hypothetical protein
MKLYFLLIDSKWFHQILTPALGASLRSRSFRPCLKLCADMFPAVQAYANSISLGQSDCLIHQISQGLPFDRSLWSALVGELLLFGAAEMPEVPNIFASLRCLLGCATHLTRANFSPVEQMELGSSDVMIGGSYYRPEQAGLNNEYDAKRLADYLDTLKPAGWSPSAFEGMPELPSIEDREEELAFIRQELPNLQHIYARARDRGQVIVCERF